MHSVTPKAPSKRPYHRHPGLTYEAAAKQLGVTIAHLNFVVRGKRQSRRLLARYHALMQRHGKAAA